jgi:hypothetical protein
MTPEIEAEIRARDQGGFSDGGIRDRRDLLTALDAERKAHAETRRAWEPLVVMAGKLAGRLDGIFDAAIAAGGDREALRDSETAPAEVQRFIRAEKARADALEAKLRTDRRVGSRRR